ncbi:MAG TPA: hypothetical protein PKJ63_14630 [Cyclobacteriaceae bacterium]|nr:hypothetical protein [Cyclobacteriaceae bacterium]
MSEELEKKLKELEGLTDAHLTFCSKMLQADESKMFPVDILAAATIKRSLALIQAFTTLVRLQNYTTAASLLRLQLDSCLRLSAAFLVEKPHDMAMEVLSGKPVRKMKDRNGRFMHDRHLVESLAPRFEWLPRVYEATSGFIHLSEKHLHSVFESVEEENSIGLRIAADDENVPEHLWLELTEGFQAATDALFEYLSGWIFTKANPELVAKMEEEKLC